MSHKDRRGAFGKPHSTRYFSTGQAGLHYRDESGLKADVIIAMPDGRWAAFEVKLGASAAIVDAAATNLLDLRDKVNAYPPLALGVITGSGYGIVRKDGVLQIPIGAPHA